MTEQAKDKDKEKVIVLTGTVLLSEWAQANKLSEQATRMLAQRREIQISRFGGADFVDAEPMNKAFITDIILQAQRADSRKKYAKRKRDELAELKKDYEILKNFYNTRMAEDLAKEGGQNP